jgi:carotene biosynthesis associated membrane protein
MKLVRILFLSHLAALIFGLGGILIALPHPEWWADSTYGRDVFQFGMEYGGSLHIILGAATMLAFGGLTIGWRRTLTFFVVTVALSLSSELIGTGTGWPFGNYEYTSGLGYKVLGRVPFTIPLSWFYVGFASYLLMNRLAEHRLPKYQGLLAVLGGAYLLTVWDLVLDPAMAHESLAIQFWTWSETGPYFGMPLKNFVGWTLTAVLFMGISRLFWRRDVRAADYIATVPFAIYLVNMLFAMVLSAGVDLWGPVVLAVFFGIIPAALAWKSRPAAPEAVVRPSRQVSSSSPGVSVAQRVMATGAKVIGARGMDLRVEGIEHVPTSGPALLAARHYHHLNDGCALLAATRRPVHILVALDWVKGGAGRGLMERACKLAGWPVVLRDDGLAAQSSPGAFHATESRQYLRRAVRESVDLLRAGELLVVFPEAYPNIDPAYTPKIDTEFLPFRPGFVRLVELAERDGTTRVPIVPVGFAYEPIDGKRWQVVMRVGAPIWLSDGEDRVRVVQLVEDQVRYLSKPAEPFGAMVAREAVSS